MEIWRVPVIRIWVQRNKAERVCGVAKEKEGLFDLEFRQIRLSHLAKWGLRKDSVAFCMHIRNRRHTKNYISCFYRAEGRVTRTSGYSLTINKPKVEIGRLFLTSVTGFWIASAVSSEHKHSYCTDDTGGNCMEGTIWHWVYIRRISWLNVSLPILISADLTNNINWLSVRGSSRQNYRSI